MKTLKIILKIILVASLTTFAITFLLKDDLPPEPLIVDDLYQDPIQKYTDEPIIEKKEGDIEYTIEPLYSFEEWGLVVSVSNNEKWYSRSRDTDPLNSKDICVIWGKNIEGEHYLDSKYSSKEFVCYFYPKTDEASNNFSGLHLANNHLLPKNNEIYKTIKNTKVGDQIHFKGFLSNYEAIQKNGQKWTRGTSTTRDDTGNDACETVYVTDFEILVVGNPLAISLFIFSKYLSILILVILFFLIFVRETKEPSDEANVVASQKSQNNISHIDPKKKKPRATIVKRYEEKNEKVELEDLLPPARED